MYEMSPLSCVYEEEYQKWKIITSAKDEGEETQKDSLKVTVTVIEIETDNRSSIPGAEIELMDELMEVLLWSPASTLFAYSLLHCSWLVSPSTLQFIKFTPQLVGRFYRTWASEWKQYPML